MWKGRPVTYCAVAAILFCLPKVALSQHQTLQVHEVTIPSSIGYVLEATEAAPPASPSRSTPIVIHIQEAHTNYEAQKNIVAILEQLVKEHGLKLILVEGGEGDVSLAYLRNHGTPTRRKDVAEKYLKAGILSAEEYLDITSSAPLTLWGIEQDALYEQNVEAFLKAEALHASMQPMIAAVHQATESLRPHIASADLNELDAKAAAFERHELDLNAYVDVLRGLAQRVGYSLTAHPHLDRLISLRRTEQAVELPRVQQEQQALIRRLAQHVANQQIEQVVDQALAMRKGSITPAAFYPQLQQLAATAKIQLATDYPHLARYITYIADSAAIDPTQLPAELDAAATALRGQLTSNAAAKQFSALLDEVDLVEKLIGLRLTPEEHRRLQAIDLSKAVSTWREFLDRQRAHYGLPAISWKDLDQVPARLATLQQFYQVAQQRDEVIVGNTIAKLRDSGEPLAVLITGGFHSPAITQRLKTEGIGTVVLTPKVGRPTDERLYMAVVKYKSGRGSLEDVMALANSSSQAREEHR